MRAIAILTASIMAAAGSNSGALAETPDATLAAIQSARQNPCPAGRVQAGARNEAFGAQKDVAIAELATTPMQGEPARRVRLVRVTVAPGGVIGWHEHAGDQGMAILVSGSAIELRNDCRDAIAHKPGDILLERADTAHGFRNDGQVPAVFLVSHGLPRD